VNTSLSTKIQVGLGAIALAAATTISPVVAHATPGHAPFAQDQTGAGGGGKANNPNKSGSSGDNSGARHTGRPGPAPGASTTTEAPATVGPATAAAPKAAATPKANANANPVKNLITVAVKITGTIVYGTLDTVAGVIRLTGQAITQIPVIGPPIGKVFVAVADATQKVAYAVAEATHVGPYSTTG
jgi:hypothetical protein